MVHTRRQFVVGCSAGIAALMGSRLTGLALGAPPAVNHTLLIVSLRGGWDGLTVVPPLGNDHKHYADARPSLKIPEANLIKLSDEFGLNPALAPLAELYTDRHLAVVQAAGLTLNTRSHFDAMESIELGMPGERQGTSGWLGRALRSIGGGDLSAVAVGAQSTIFSGSPAISMSDFSELAIEWDDSVKRAQRAALARLYDGPSSVHAAGARTLAAIKRIEELGTLGDVTSPKAKYPEHEFGNHLRLVATLIKRGVGLRAATVELGGWDTHEGQGEAGGGHIGGQLEALAAGLAAFYRDLDNGRPTFASRTTVVVMSEFGRTVAENGSGGTDHGHGSVILVLGGKVQGGRVVGAWPGLAADARFDGVDLDVTTDYRQIVSEVLSGTMGLPDISETFPGFSPGPSLELIA